MPTQEKVNAGVRIGSMVLDQVFMTVICMLFFIPMNMSETASVLTISHEQNAFVNFNSPVFYIALFGLALFFCKDGFNGRSIAKRITKLQVVDNTTGKAASPLQCFVRNIFCIIWPVEGLVTLIDQSRRIGDRVAGTKVVHYDAATAEKPGTNFTKLLLSVVLSFALVVSLAFAFQALALQPSGPKVNYVKSSYNDAESKALEKLYSDSLGKYLTASVRVYDTITNSHLKYISVIYELKGDYLEDYDSRRALTGETMKHLYSLFPENTFSGWAQYIFHQGGTYQSVNNEIGVRIISSTN